MKKFLAAASFLLLSLQFSFAQKTVQSFKEAMESEVGCIVKVKKATVLAASADFSVVSDGETSMFVASPCLFSLHRGDVISIKGERSTHRGSLPVIRCIEHKELRSHGDAPPEDLQDINAVQKSDIPIPVMASGILVRADKQLYLYMPDQLRPVTNTRVELVCSPDLTAELAGHVYEHIQVTGYFIQKMAGNIPISLMLAYGYESVPNSTLKTLSSSHNLEKGEMARLVATVSSVDSLGFEICDFSGAARMDRMDVAGIAPGKRVLLTISRNDDSSEPDIAGLKVYGGKSYPDSVSLYHRLGGHSERYGDFEQTEGGYIIKGVPFNGRSSFALQESGQRNIKIVPVDFTEGNTIFMVRSLLRERFIKVKVPRGVYDIWYFPEADAAVFRKSDIQFDGPYPGDDIEKEGAIPFQMLEQKPSFNGGDANEFSKWVNAHLRYPEEAKAARIQGRVTLQFTIEPDGYVTNIRVLRGAHPLLDAEAVRVLSLSPRWKPGFKDGRPVKVTYTFPVIFGFQ